MDMESLLKSYDMLLHKWASRYAEGGMGFTKDDLYAAGLRALWLAERDYDATKGKKNAFIVAKVKQAMLDEAAALSPYSKAVYKEHLRRGDKEQQLDAALGHRASTEEQEQAIGAPRAAFVNQSIAGLTISDDLGGVADKDLVDHVIETSPTDTERRVAIGLFRDGQAPKDIAACLGLVEATISFHKKRIVERARRYLFA